MNKELRQKTIFTYTQLILIHCVMAFKNCCDNHRINYQF